MSAWRISLDLAGLIFLADIDAVARRTAYMGGISFADVLVLCPGLHKQQHAPGLSKGEYPACAAMTTGYVFRVENEATVLYLQRMSKTGRLTTLSVTSETDTAALTVALIAYLCLRGDLWAVLVLAILVLVRICNYVVLGERLSGGWHGQREPGVRGDLLVLLSQDRWVRLRGAVDDLKAVTSGQWLQDPKEMEIILTTLGTLSVYFAAILLVNATNAGRAVVLFLVILNAVLVMIANADTKVLRMNGKLLKSVGEPKAYGRRLDLAHELIKETGRKDWALRMGMVQPEKGEEGPVVM
ncbi:hypothetical protein LTR22_007696 [Elasticomyces elasticus]|nr:hypothetical protein LTR22_007696 [Elasticomyces elasticus]KAK4921077.1 hypothetical protein LTR49_011447 [Elasticomyces elasticus]